MPIYEYRCERCGKKSTSLLPSYASADPPCPHCGELALKRLVSTFATARPSEGGGDDWDGAGTDSFDGGDSGDGDDGGGDFGGGDFGDDDY